MAQVQSTLKLKIGEILPDFTLPATNGYGTLTLSKDLSQYSDLKGFIVVFTCNHCPFAKHIADALSNLARTYKEKGFYTYAISSNDSESYPEDGPEKMREEAEFRKFSFPYLFDSTQEVAKQYFAACTPDFFVGTADRRLYYRGSMDETTPNETGSKANGNHLIGALEGILAGSPPPELQQPSIGCNIKWKPGNEPEYFKN